VGKIPISGVKIFCCKIKHYTQRCLHFFCNSQPVISPYSTKNELFNPLSEDATLEGFPTPGTVHPQNRIWHSLRSIKCYVDLLWGIFLKSAVHTRCELASGVVIPRTRGCACFSGSGTYTFSRFRIYPREKCVFQWVGHAPRTRSFSGCRGILQWVGCTAETRNFRSHGACVLQYGECTPPGDFLSRHSAARKGRTWSLQGVPKACL
jgi:hypothetical protein